MRRLPLLLTTAALCAVLACAGSLDGTPEDRPAPTSGRGPADAAHRGSLDSAISKDQQHLQALPGDADGWARLGGEYVEQARLTADSSYYPKADEALRRSMGLKPDDNIDALTGFGALANARHQFGQARQYAEQAIAAAPAHWPAYAVLVDARTQLGDDTGATDAAQQLLDLHPGTAAFTRAAYDLEQHGRADDARNALRRALQDAYDPSDRAFSRYQLAELDLAQGRAGDALAGYRQTLDIDPSYTPAVAGTARAEAALGRTGDALTHYAQATARLPLPQYLLELGELQESLGHRQEAAEQYRLLAAEQHLAAANGVVDDLSLGQYQADHGDPAEAVRLLRAEWGRRQNVLVADALAWALHRTGADSEALTYAERAAAHGWDNALFLYHRGEIEKSLGHLARARTLLTRAIATNPAFHPLQAPLARRDLDDLGN